MHQRHVKEMTEGAHFRIRRYNHIVLYCTVNDVALWERYVATLVSMQRRHIEMVYS